jgi:hypothetical protein
MRSRSLLFLTALITFLLPFAPAHAVVNGDTADAEQYRAIVSISSGCTGTFIHPRFIVTAAHCIRPCATLTDRGCVTGTDTQVVLGTAAGLDGAVPLSGSRKLTATDGLARGAGNIYPVDYVYFARSSDLNRGRPADVAILRTTIWFNGQVIPAFPAQDLPKPDESNYCKRWEYTWPWMAGFSSNAGTQSAQRRIGRAFAECDLELDETTFKLDGHGREGQKGVRSCPGDSGGPILWESGYGGYAVGGVSSATDDYVAISDTRCPSERGESYNAFIPEALLNRVAATDGLCQGETQWRRCPGVPVPYGGHAAEYNGTEIEQCDKNDSLKVAGSYSVTLSAGQTKEVFVPDNEYDWTCGGTPESTTAASSTDYVITKRALTDSQIIWDTYDIGKPDADGQKQPWIIDALNDDNRPAVAMSEDGKDLDMIENVGGNYHRTYSPDYGIHWFIPTMQGSGEIPVSVGQIGNGVFVSAPATAVSNDGLRLHVVGRGTDDRFHHAMSEDGGSTWVVAWQPLGGGVFKSAPAITTHGDGSQLHVFGIGMDNKMYHGLYVVGTDAAGVTWEVLGTGVFIGAPAAVTPLYGSSSVYAVGLGADNRMYITRRVLSISNPGTFEWTPWASIPAGVFTSGPAVVTDVTGSQVHVFGVGMDSRIWRASSSNSGSSWTVAWVPVGAGVFSSGPAATMSADGKRIHLFGRGVPYTQFPDQFSPPVRVWRAFSADGGNNWNPAFVEVVPVPD